jgi:phosphoribosylformylglycinamidine synthase
LALDEESPTSAVQIGDPITQKKMLDFLLEARDLLLFTAITDNGAGGLSSSLGEMAEKSGGVAVYLDKCPLKYQGLAPWEILVSESQERMSVSVPEENLERFLALAKRRGVEATAVGTFTDSGTVEIYYGDRLLGLIDLEFLHNGLPPMELHAAWKPREDIQTADGKDDRSATGSIPSFRPRPRFEQAEGSPPLEELLEALLADPNIASKEHLVRQYDHEVQGHSIVKPFTGKNSDAPSDGAVIKPLYDSYRGITVTHGICPRVGDIDAYHMARAAVDEAYRGHIACGGDPELVSALDNFCWPDPVESDYTPDGRYKLAQLVRAARGLKDACLAYEIPLISGKDSMKNDARIGNLKVSIRPTLLISLMGIITDVRRAMSTDFKTAGDCIFIVGRTTPELGGSSYQQITGNRFSTCPEADTQQAMTIYNTVAESIERGLLASCHDISDGGLAVAAAECCIGGELGAELYPDRLPGDEMRGQPIQTALFSETPSRFLISVPPSKRTDFEDVIRKRGVPASHIGTVTEKPVLCFAGEDRVYLQTQLTHLITAWKSFMGKSG